MRQFVQKIIKNRHTTGSALAYLIVEVGQQIFAAWFPQHADNIYETSRIVSRGIVGYGLIMAGDAQPQQLT